MGSLLPFVSINVLNENRKTYKKSTTGFTRDGRPVAHSADPIPPHELPRIKEYFLNGKINKKLLQENGIAFVEI